MGTRFWVLGVAVVILGCGLALGQAQYKVPWTFPGAPDGFYPAGSLVFDRLGSLYGFSRKLENHAAATALNYFAYNFIKIHRTLRMSPAMAAGVTDRLWSVEDLVALWEAYEQRRAERAA